MIPEIVTVVYKYIDGAHCFVSGDEATAGLCVTHTDLGIAYRKVASEIGALFEDRCGKSVQFVPELPFETFERWLAMIDSATSAGPVPGIAGEVHWRSVSASCRGEGAR